MREELIKLAERVFTPIIGGFQGNCATDIVDLILKDFLVLRKSEARTITPRRIIGCAYLLNGVCTLESKDCNESNCTIEKVIVISKEK